ncbi:MAG: hypothetical protein WB775_09890 [Burkholderiaceae bacterium]
MKLRLLAMDAVAQASRTTRAPETAAALTAHLAAVATATPLLSMSGDKKVRPKR